MKRGMGPEGTASIGILLCPTKLQLAYCAAASTKCLTPVLTEPQNLHRHSKQQGQRRSTCHTQETSASARDLELVHSVVAAMSIVPIMHAQATAAAMHTVGQCCITQTEVLAIHQLEVQACSKSSRV
jgi:hypothetical protein